MSLLLEEAARLRKQADELERANTPICDDPFYQDCMLPAWNAAYEAVGLRQRAGELEKREAELNKQ